VWLSTTLEKPITHAEKVNDKAAHSREQVVLRVPEELLDACFMVPDGKPVSQVDKRERLLSLPPRRHSSGTVATPARPLRPR
jgi:hypothetical protein